MKQDPIFSNEIPMPPRKLLRGAAGKPTKSEGTTKRKYTRKAPEIPPPGNGAQTDGIEPKYAPLCTVSEVQFSSFGLEYVKALTDLLALIAEAQRAKLVDFIIQEKII